MIAADSATSLPIFPYGPTDSAISSSPQDKITECFVSSPSVFVPSATLRLAPSAEVEEGITRLEGGLVIEPYVNEEQLHSIARLIKADLSEPYSLYTYRYFIHNWPSLTFLVSLSWYLFTLSHISTSNVYSNDNQSLTLCSVWTSAVQIRTERGRWWAPSCANWSRTGVECVADTSRCSPLGLTIAGAASHRRSSDVLCYRWSARAVTRCLSSSFLLSLFEMHLLQPIMCSFLFTNAGCARDWVFKSRSATALWKTWLYEGPTAVPLLFKWQRCFALETLLDMIAFLYSCSKTCMMSTGHRHYNFVNIVLVF